MITEQQLQDALQVVAEMRKFQKEYFNERKAGRPGKQELIESKRLETRVDMLLAEYGIRAH